MNSPTAADRFRQAIRRGAHQDAERVLDELRSEVETLWNAAASRQQRQEIAAEITSLLEWARQSVISSRSHTQAKLVRLGRQRTYLVTGVERREHIHLNG